MLFISKDRDEKSFGSKNVQNFLTERNCRSENRRMNEWMNYEGPSYHFPSGLKSHTI